MSNLTLLLAQVQQESATEQINDFLDGGVGQFIKVVLVTFGFVVVIFSLSKVVMKALQGNTTGAVKSFLIGLFLAALLFNLAFIGNFIDWASGLWGAVADTGTEVISDATK